MSREWDAVVVGSGAAGLTAAVTAARAGLSVLVVEKTDVFGGTTALSGGGIWIPDNHHQQAAGLPEPDGAARRYVAGIVGGDLRGEVLDAYLAAGPRMVRFLEDETEVRFALADHSPDWHPEVDGASKDGRLLRPLEYSMTRLDGYADELRDPRAEFNAPGGFMIDLPDLPHLQGPKTPKALAYIARLAARFAWDKLRGRRRGSRLTMGNALAARLLRSAHDAGVTLWRDTPVLGLIGGTQGITGVRVRHDGETLNITARKGVVLATGGFSANEQLRRAYMPYPDQHISIMAGCNTGDGMNMGLDAGGTVDGENVANGVWSVVSTMTMPDGTTAIYAHLIDMAKPGCIAVDRHGQRFGNEASNTFVDYMHKAGAVPAWLVADAAFVKKYGLGLVFPGAMGLKKLVAAGYMAEATGLAGLAARIGVDATGLQATVDRINHFAETGKDADFAKGDSFLDRDLGDPAHAPNPCLGPVWTAPFYAVKIFPGDGSTTVGLKIDGQARVLDDAGRMIPGLYAAGLDAHSIWRGHAPAHGCNVGPAMTLGYIAGRSMAG
ncbi:FAD-dependent oxidoreductase [Sphingomonas solaris]|uniref:FAD-dependent oxidoreductase n=1 Tax=Alterirhizorhabdus solaris TaxID=2529389 RepID=A0A558RCQ4_9SPHN|nr:FAD-dependent oxidoreductase [Sphingomonas solaris]TVV77110.1 FAD-dependent oxidoreductase [Sphingomonas solaris]